MINKLLGNDRKYIHNLFPSLEFLKFIYSEKATKFCKISTVDLTGTIKDKSTVEILQNFVALTEYMNFISLIQFFMTNVQHEFIVLCRGAVRVGVLPELECSE